MAIARPHRLAALTALVVFVTVLGVLSWVNGSTAPSTPFADNPDAAATAQNSRSTDGRIRALQQAVRVQASAKTFASLGFAYLQKVRETGDASFYPRAEGVLRSALARDPRNVSALTGMGTLALARHDFRGGLRWGRAAHRAGPAMVAPYPVMTDGLVELGRYREAGRTLQRYVDLRPTLASYARVSYFRELHGDLPGAIAAMRLAVDAGGDAAENGAYVRTLLGTLELNRGRSAAASTAYRSALADFPRYVPALAGLARVDAAHGRYGSAIRRYRTVIARLPLPEYVIGLGDTELAAGRPAAARRDLALVGAEEQLLRANGVNTDVDLALFEADHGSPGRGVVLARRAWSDAPSVRSADALGWALTRSGRAVAGEQWGRRALRLGSRDPMFLYHAGMSARSAGDRGVARVLLGRAVALNPRFSPVYGLRAQRALRNL